MPIMMLIAWLAMLSALTEALAHDSWISRGQYTNKAGDFCCGEKDCFVVEHVEEVPGGCHIWGEQPGLADKADMATGFFPPIMRPFDEVIPYSEAQPSPDGQFWRCALQNGKRRCFFAPPPST